MPIVQGWDLELESIFWKSGGNCKEWLLYDITRAQSPGLDSLYTQSLWLKSFSKAMEPWMKTYFPTKCSNQYISTENTGHVSSLSTSTFRRLSPLRNPASGETFVDRGHSNMWKQTTCSEVPTQQRGLVFFVSHFSFCLTFLMSYPQAAPRYVSGKYWRHVYVLVMETPTLLQ